MKKLLTLALAGVLALSLMACGESAKAPELGSMSVAYAEDVNESDYDKIAEGAADKTDVAIALYTDGKSAQSVMVESGTLDESGTEFAPEKAIFGSDLVGPDTLVLLQVPYFETLPNLRLTYTGAEGTVHYYITQSGKDGSLVLVDAD